VPEALWGDAHFRKAVALARMGLGKSAKRELGQVPTPADEAQRRAGTWSTVAIYDLAGAPERATALARREEPRFGAHWPAGDHRRLWELAHPRPYRKLVERHARERDVDPFWVWSIMREESGFNPRIVSWANAIGLMQIIPATGRLLARRAGIAGDREALKRPEVAINLGSLYLSRLLAKHDQVPLASAGYNAGGGAVAKWRRELGRLPIDEFVERIPYDEARGYAKRVTRSLARYTWLYAGERMLTLSLAPVGAP
jgi:soluble lytic murein transglycosylase